jgi:hypothetical protein
LTHASSYATVANGIASEKSIKFQDDLIFEMSLTFMFEILVSIKAEDLGMMFLIYDCQHFSESIITKSLNLLMKFYKDDHA